MVLNLVKGGRAKRAENNIYFAGMSSIGSDLHVAVGAPGIHDHEIMSDDFALRIFLHVP